ncbi:helix-turn-helix domain-containing protein [Eubacterium sp.]|uniref:helix-turn-helix domain-containing protein n=1 Tax=Eubacterium sp. TaxID=142586 RepID=UPI0034CE4942
MVLISQDDLANFVGMNRANVAKYLKQLREEKIIETARNRIIVKNTKNHRITPITPIDSCIFP